MYLGLGLGLDNLSGGTYLEETDSPSLSNQQMPAVLPLREGPCDVLPTLAGMSTGIILMIVWAAILSRVHGQSSPAMCRRLLHEADVLVLALTIFPPPPLRCPLSLRWRSCISDEPSGVEYPTICCSMKFDRMWVSVMASICCRRKLIW